MLILSSNGLSSDKIITTLQDKLKGLKTSALVVTADNEYKEKNYHVKRCIEELKSLNLDTMTPVEAITKLYELKAKAINN